MLNMERMKSQIYEIAITGMEQKQILAKFIINLDEKYTNFLNENQLSFHAQSFFFVNNVNKLKRFC